MRTSISSVMPMTTPLCFMPDGRFLCYHRGFIHVFSDGKNVCSWTIPMNWKERLLGWSKLLTRLLRLGVRVAESVNDESIIISIGNMLYEMNTKTGTLSKGYFCGDGIRPLIITNVQNIDGFDNGLYFGEYLGNRGKNPVNVYHRINKDKWEVVYTFPQGSINHVHNIIADPYRQCLWIFTGDFDEASAVWKVTEGFQKVERVVCGDQKYRGCVVFALRGGLLYATDAPFVDDYIYLMNTETFEVKEILPIDGSCIYGCQWKDKFVFSSTVEGDGRNMSRLQFLFGRTRGAGVKDEYVHMYCGNLKDGFKEIYKEQKDRMPFYSFQFGVFKFPYGVNNSNTLFFQPVATKKNDLRLMRLE